jgi:hypothetical protein
MLYALYVFTDIGREHLVRFSNNLLKFIFPKY